ncbi:transglycosylase family protein, partial [Streptacidiphilus neutrinimicus]|uniref:LysM peptidoglycan-binding domain-containing protein n=1 Tax=Streptacidiphilus neutrinimicus TaxID=105420 RepID=UPI0005A631FE
MGAARRRLLAGGAIGAASLACVLPVVSDVASAQVPVAVWDRLALCESSGRWHIATGNGYYGGLQISRETWREAGGGRYASRPDHATKAEQIRVAEAILAWQGWSAWPNCSQGLTGRPPVGATHSPPHSPTPEPSRSHTPRPTPRPTPTSTPRPTPRPTPTSTPVPTPVPTPTPTPTRTPTPTPTPAPPVTVPATYVVQPGDQLVSIAHRFHLPGGWPALYARNRALIGPRPDDLVAGTVLRLR